MTPEVAGFLIANLLLLGNVALSADIAESSLTGGGVKLRDPVGTQYEVRRKRALPDDSKYEAAGAQHLGDLTMSGTDGEHFGDSQKHWNNDDDSKLVSRHQVVRRDWGGSDMAWIRRRSALPKSRGTGTVVEVLGPHVRRRHGWSDAGMKWLKRSDETADVGPVKRHSEDWQPNLENGDWDSIEGWCQPSVDHPNPRVRFSVLVGQASAGGRTSVSYG